jgi:hypothetical protein
MPYWQHGASGTLRVEPAIGPTIKKPPAEARPMVVVVSSGDQAWAPSTFCNSPDSYISIMMSEPPMNSPLT